MSFNGSGTFVINSAGQPVVANTVISATTFNALTSDLANGLSTCITKDGQTTPTANIPMGGFKITNLATGTAATDAATVAQIQSNGAALVTVTGTDTLTGTLTPALVAYVTGAVYYFVAPATNTGAVTLNIDTLGAKAVTRDGTTALVAGDIVSGEMVAVVYDGTRFQLISAVNSFTNLNVSGTLTVAGATTLNGNLQVGNAAADTVNFQASGWTLTNNVSVIGTWADIGTITTADINGGTIDGTTIGGGTAAAGTFTTVGATTGNITTVNATTVDSTNLEVTNLKAKDGTAAGSIADATGVVTLNSLVATTADINGGTIDATTIGGSSPAVGNFTTVSAASAVFTTATITTVNTTTLDLTNLEVTNIKAKDGTASMVIDDATGKVNVTTVSAASMNAAVAAVTTLNATSASAASINAAVALITTGTVTNLIATGASITSANVGALQVTNASVASANFGTAQITAVSAASANLGVAAITTGSVTNLTATSASVASMNAGVALLTTATVTTLNASGASIASANIGNLQFTAASIASINAGVAVINNLTATSASIASANVGVALITTGTVTALTATGASVASANVGTAVITGLTVTGASIASVNAGTVTLSGNLTLNGGTANGVLYLNGSKVATSGSAFVFDGTNVGIGTSSPGAKLEIRDTNATAIFSNSATRYGFVQWENTGGELRIGTDGVFGLRFDTNAQRRMTLDSSGNLGLGVTPSAWVNAKAIDIGTYGAISSDTATSAGISVSYNAYGVSATSWKYKNSYSATRYTQEDGLHKWFNAASGTINTAISFTQAMTLTAAGDLCVGTTSSLSAASNRQDITVNGASSSVFTLGVAGTRRGYLFTDGSDLTLSNEQNNALILRTNATERARITSGGNLLVGTTTDEGGRGHFTSGSATNAGVVVTGAANTQGKVQFSSLNKNYYIGGGQDYLGMEYTVDGGQNHLWKIGTTERARITSGGLFLVNATTSSGFGDGHRIFRDVAENTTVLSVDGGTEFSAQFRDVASGGYSTAGTAIIVGKNSSTSRSINAGGTVNASGADYAEYMEKAGEFFIAKGDVCGIDANGKLTNVYANAVAFVVKSTNPSYVGGDSWGAGYKDDPEGLEAARQKVDRIAFSGQVPVNVLGATPGQYIVPVNDNGAIKGMAVSNPSFEQYQMAIGKVIAIEDDGRARIIVKIA
jgi:hypothetical protein